MEDILTDTVSQYFVRNKEDTQAEAEAELTNLLFFSRWPLTDPEETMRELLNKGPRQVCQYQFKKNGKCLTILYAPHFLALLML
jgi:hypothetical protein